MTTQDDTKTRHTIADFKAFIQQPENSEYIFELINGDIIQVPSSLYASVIAGHIITFIHAFLMQNKIKGHVTAPGGGYIIRDNVFAPDVAYISYERQATLPREGFNPGPPNLAVEVLSDPSSPAEQQILRRKMWMYLRSGTILWIVDPEDRTVEVHHPSEAMTVFGEKDTLTIENVLPGFELIVDNIFPE